MEIRVLRYFLEIAREENMTRAVKRLNQRYPGIQYHIVSGDTAIVAERLDRGLFDMAFIVEPPDLSKNNYLEEVSGIYACCTAFIRGTAAGIK